jgi:hypothetical protein
VRYADAVFDGVDRYESGMKDPGLLQLAGHFPMRPLRINFDLTYQASAGSGLLGIPSPRSNNATRSAA